MISAMFPASLRAGTTTETSGALLHVRTGNGRASGDVGEREIVEGPELRQPAIEQRARAGDGSGHRISAWLRSVSKPAR